MASDPEAAEEVRTQWRNLRRTQGLLVAHLDSGTAFAPWVAKLASPMFAMLLPIGMSVLETYLKQLRSEGVFVAESNQLGHLMEGARKTLAWHDFDRVNAGRNARNAYAHRQEIPTAEVSLATLDAIERELIEWGVLEGPVRYDINFHLTSGPSL